MPERTVSEPMEYWDVLEEDFDDADFDVIVAGYVDELEDAA